jgi:hypothetical protein
VILANVIFPAFATPYVSAMLFPLAGLAAMTVEVIVLKLLNRDARWTRLTALVVGMNVASGILGFLLAAVLPSGLVPELVGTGEHQANILQPGPHFGLYAILGFITAFIISVLIEYWIVRAARAYVLIAKPFKAIVLANAASYATLTVFARLWAHFL